VIEFEEHRAHLRAVAYQMLGSVPEAEDAVQEAWLRMDRTDVSDVHNMRGWLTTVVAHICLDMLRARTARPEQQLDETVASRIATAEPVDPEQEALLADSVGTALLVILQRLSPAERLAFVLHDMFDLPFAEIAPIVGRSENTAAQLAVRARRRVHGQTPDPATDLVHQRRLVEAFLTRPASVLSRSQLEARLYGWQEPVDSNAVEVHLHALRRKLGADAIRNVRGVGWSLAPLRTSR